MCVWFSSVKQALRKLSHLQTSMLQKKKTKTKTTATLCFRGSVFASFFFFLATRACRDNRALQNTLGTKKKKKRNERQRFSLEAHFFSFVVLAFQQPTSCRNNRAYKTSSIQFPPCLLSPHAFGCLSFLSASLEPR